MAASSQRRPSPSATSHVVIVGGGVIGLAIAWRLSQEGHLVTVVDPAPAGAASYAAAGMLAPVSEVTYGEQPLLTLALESLRRYPQFVAGIEVATGREVGLRRDGTLIAATAPGDRETLLRLHDFQNRLGLTATVLTSAQARSLEPALGPAVRTALLVETDHSVDNRRLTRALLSGLVTAGGDVVDGSVSELVSDSSGVTGVALTDGRTLAADLVVIAAGPWSARVGGLPPDGCAPVRPVKGQILRLQAPDPRALPDRTIRGVVDGEDVYLVPRTDGELVVGATVEDRGFDTTVTAGAVHELLRAARTVVPVVDEFALVETIAAARPGSPDNAPVIGSTSTPGLFVATGHFRNGVLLAPITADLIADLIAGRDVDPALAAAITPDRFTPVAAGA